MNQENYQLLTEILCEEITSLDRYLELEISSKDLLLEFGLPTQELDLTITRLSAKLILANETLNKLKDWSN